MKNNENRKFFNSLVRRYQPVKSYSRKFLTAWRFSFDESLGDRLEEGAFASLEASPISFGSRPPLKENLWRSD